MTHCISFPLQAFAGIRRAEAECVHWEWLACGRNRIVLPGWAFSHDIELKQRAKTQDDWVMQGLPDNLWGWLERYRQPKGQIRYPGDDSLVDIRKLFAKLEDNLIGPWPRNALRHTFCTMPISLYQSVEKTALFLRHQNTRQLYQHYLAKRVARIRNQ